MIAWILLCFVAVPASAEKEEGLMRQIKAGGPQATSAYAELYAAFFEREVSRLGRRLPALMDAGGVEDVVQEVFIRLWNLPLEERPESYGWVVSNCYFAGLNYLEQRRKMQLMEFGQSEPEEGIFRLDPQDQGQQAPDIEAANREEGFLEGDIAGRLDLITGSMTKAQQALVQAVASGVSVEILAEQTGQTVSQINDKVDTAARRMNHLVQSDPLIELSKDEMETALSLMPNDERRVLLAKRRGASIEEIARRFALSTPQVSELRRQATFRLELLLTDKVDFQKKVRTFVARRLFMVPDVSRVDEYVAAYFALTPNERAALYLRWQRVPRNELRELLPSPEGEVDGKYLVMRALREMATRLNVDRVALSPLPRDFEREAETATGMFVGLGDEKQQELITYLGRFSRLNYTVIQLRYLGNSFPDIAAAVGLTLPSVHKRYYDSLRNLEELLEMGGTKLVLATPPSKVDRARELSKVLFVGLNRTKRALLARELEKIGLNWLLALELRNGGMRLSLLARRFGYRPFRIEAILKEIVSNLERAVGEPLEFALPEERAERPSWNTYFAGLSEDQNKRLAEMIAVLPMINQRILRMRLDGSSIEEISDDMGWSLPAIRKKLYGTIHGLRERIGVRPLRRIRRQPEDYQVISYILAKLKVNDGSSVWGEANESLETFTPNQLQWFASALRGDSLDQIQNRFQLDSRTFVFAMETLKERVTRLGIAVIFSTALPDIGAEPRAVVPNQVDRAELSKVLFLGLNEAKRTLLAQELEKIPFVWLAALELRNGGMRMEVLARRFGRVPGDMASQLQSIVTELERALGETLEFAFPEEEEEKPSWNMFFGGLSDDKNKHLEERIAALPAKERAIVQMRLDGKSFEEIAGAVGWQFRTVRAKFYQLINSLRENMGVSPLRRIRRQVEDPELIAGIVSRLRLGESAYLNRETNNTLQTFTSKQLQWLYSALKGEALDLMACRYHLESQTLAFALENLKARIAVLGVVVIYPQIEHSVRVKALSEFLFQDLDIEKRKLLPAALEKVSAMWLNILELRDGGMAVRRIASQYGYTRARVADKLEAILTNLESALGERPEFSHPEDEVEGERPRELYFPGLSEAQRQPLLDSIEELSEPDKEIVKLKLSGQIFEVIVDSLGLCESTVRTRFYRAVDSLRDAVGLVIPRKARRVEGDAERVAAIILKLDIDEMQPVFASVRAALDQFTSTQLLYFDLALSGSTPDMIALQTSVTSKTVSSSLNGLRRRMETAGLAVTFPTAPIVRDSARDQSMPVQYFEGATDVDGLRIALGDLKDGDLALLTFRYQGQSFAEIASARETDAKTVEMRFNHLLRRLRRATGCSALKIAPNDRKVDQTRTIAYELFPSLSGEEKARLQLALKRLTARQLDALEWRARGASVAEIAESRGAALSNFSRDFNTMVTRLSLEVGVTLQFPKVARRVRGRAGALPAQGSIVPFSVSPATNTAKCLGEIAS